MFLRNLLDLNWSQFGQQQPPSAALLYWAAFILSLRVWHGYLSQIDMISESCESILREQAFSSLTLLSVLTQALDSHTNISTLLSLVLVFY